jgi:DNA-binding transcriptional LysR family regulator
MEHAFALIVFARVVESGSFSAAARALGLSKAGVSKHVSRLEARYGLRLLNRTTRRLSLTEAGRDVYERAARVAEETAAADAAALALTETPRGRLRLTLPTSYGLRRVSPLLPAFLARYPEVGLEVTVSDRHLDLVGEGIDLAIRIGELPDSSLTARRIGESRMIVCAAPAYLDAHGRPARPSDLKGHRCLVYSGAAPPGEWRFAGDKAVRVAGDLVSDNGDVLIDAACAGLGVCRTPDFLAEAALADGKLESVLEDCETRPLPIYAVHTHGRHPAAKVRAFIDFLAAQRRASAAAET